MPGRLVDGYVAYSQHPERCEKSLATVLEGHSGMVREALFNQDMSIETPHFFYGKYTDTAKGTGSDVQYLAFG